MGSRFAHRFNILATFAVLLLSTPLFAAPVGSEASPDLYQAAFVGGGAFTTATGGSQASAVNPAAGALEQRITLDLGYAALAGITGENGLGHAINLGLLYPTKVAVFGGSTRFLTSPFDAMPLGTTVSIDLTAAKELYPGLSIGAGISTAAGSEWGAALDLGVAQDLGTIWKLQSFRWAFTLQDLGKSAVTTAFTPAGGVEFDVIQKGPFKLGFKADLGAPGFQNLTGKLGIEAHIADILSVTSATGFNLKEASDDVAASYIPSIGINLHLMIAGKKPLLNDKLPTDGELNLSASARPLYDGVWAIGTGAVLNLGVKDTRGPDISVEYPETRWISPNNDGKADDLEFPISITDQRYIMEWAFEIRSATGDVVRVIRNKERRAENQGMRGILDHLTDVKSGVEIPAKLRWDGNLDSGAVAADGHYFFTISAKDDNGNASTTQKYEVVVDNTPPAITVNQGSGDLRILSPDGDGNKDTFPIAQTGSVEESWKAGILDAAGTTVRSFDATNVAPADFSWDGKDNSGRVVPDGVYRYSVESTDRALNSGKASLDNIVLNTERPVVSLLLEDSAFSPNGDGVKDSLALSPGIPVKQGIERWSLEIQDLTDANRRVISGTAAVPARFDFDGKGDNGNLLGEGSYKAKLSVIYQNGNVSTAISPAFVLDVTKPSASVTAVEGTSKDELAFSPNGDGKRDTAALAQKASTELSWTGEIRRAPAAGSPAPAGTVKTFRFDGPVDGTIAWDGRDETGKLATDGVYEYQLSATDSAGNQGASNKVSITLSTADTPVFLSTDLAAFSPNGDGVRDAITLSPQLQIKDGISAWKLDILDATRAVVKSVEGAGAAPAPTVWNGRDAKGASLPDGLYTARLNVRYAAGNNPEVYSSPFALDTVAPALELSAPYKLFSPNADGRKDTLPFSVKTAGTDDWEALILDAKGTALRDWHWKGQAPEVSWDGRDKAGNTAPDATYRLTVRSTDAAGNKTEKTIDAIGVDNRATRVFLTAQGAGLSPNKDGVADDLKMGLIVNLKDGIEGWKLEIADETGKAVKTFTAPANATGAALLPPAQLVWNGLDDDGKLVEGKRTAVFSVAYLKGDLATANAGPFIVDVTPPALAMKTSPEWFSPDNDGVDDELAIALAAPDASGVESWNLEIHEPAESGAQLFYKVSGKGTPSDRLIWDGRSNKGELVQAATDYGAVLSAVDALGNRAELKATIAVDVLVIREGDVLKIKVPSIVFRPNFSDFKDLPPEQVANNARVLKRIAFILNKFRDYKVKVEGHANPVTRTAQEEKEQLQPLSESRAKAIVAELVRLDVSKDRLSSIGMGGTRPVVPYESKADWWKNRRVEFILIK